VAESRQCAAVPASTRISPPPGPPRAAFLPLWVVAVALPLLGFLLGAWLIWRDVEDEARARLVRSVDVLHEHALRAFETQDALLTAVEARVAGLGWDEMAASEDLHLFLGRLDDATSLLRGFGIVDPAGRMIVSSARGFFPMPPNDMSARDYVRATRAGVAGSHVSDQFVSSPTGTRLFTLSRALRARGEASTPGTLVGAFSVANFGAFYASIAETQDDRVALVRLDGALLARHPPTPAPVQFAPDTPLMAVLRAQGGDAGVFRAPSAVDGVPRLNAFRRIGPYPVVVLYGIGPATLQEEAWRRLLPLAGMAGGAMLLLLMLTALVRRAARREALALSAAAAEAEAARAEAEARATAEQRLRQSERSAALGQVAAGVAHDMNNLVQAVLASAKLLERRAGAPEEVRRIAELLSAAATRGQRVAHRMLAFGRPPQRAEGFAMAEALGGLEEALGGLLGSGVRLKVEAEPSLPEVPADRSDFETVLVNLVVNARDAMPRGGLVRVRAALVQEAPSDLPSGGPWVRVSVADSGTGMTEELLQRVGEPFFSTKPPGQGTGLGLLMARQFAERAGGGMAIDSRPGEGTTVTLWLPLSRPGTAREREAA
jgi:two-component system NtrC family sensor kinase